MADVEVQKLSRKELLQLCTDNSIRTAGVKQDELIRLLQNKLHPPASDPPRGTPKSRSQVGSDSPVSSPKRRTQTSGDSPFSSPNATGKAPDNASSPTPGSTSRGRGLGPLVLVDPQFQSNSPEPSPRIPRKDGQLAPSPGPLPRKPTTTKSTAIPPQRSDQLRKKVTPLAAIVKLQAQERARPAQRSNIAASYAPRGRNNAVSGPIGKEAQEARLNVQNDRASSGRSRSAVAATGTPRKSTRSSSTPAKRTGERRILGVKSNESSSRQGKIANASAASSEAAASASSRASENEAIAGSHSDLGSHSFGSVSEAATDAGQQVLWEDSDADDARSVSSEPVSRFAGERIYSPRTSTGSKLGRVALPSWESTPGERDYPLQSSVESNAPHGKDSQNLAAALSDEFLISLCPPEDDTTFNLVGDAHGAEISSFLDAHSGAPESSTSTIGDQTNDSIAESQKSGTFRDKHTVSETAPSGMQKDKSSTSDSPYVSPSDCRQQESSVPAMVSDAPPDAKQQDAAEPSASTLGLQLTGKSDAGAKDYVPSTSPLDCIARVHFNMEGAPLPHPDMDRSSVTPVEDSSGALDSPALICAGKPSSPCDELQQGFDIKLRGGPNHDSYNKDKSRNATRLQSDGSEKVPLLQDPHENGNSALVRRSFPFSILLWCSQLFSAIFGTRSQR